MYGWGDADADGVGGAYGANGETAMFGATNTSEPCSPVDYADTYHADTHAADELYGSVAELELVRVCPIYGPVTAKY